MWGDTSIVVTRSFVDTPLGLLAFFPARAVLFGIHLAEQLAHHPFSFPANDQWIGVAAAATGAVLLSLPVAVARLGSGLYRRRRTQPSGSAKLTLRRRASA